MAAKTLRVGMVMDPIDRITPKKDSSFAMLLECQRRAAEIHYFLQKDLKLVAGRALGHSRSLTVRDNNDDWFTLGEAQEIDLGDLDVIIMRKDPPFDMEYIYTSYILERAEIQGAMVVNRPQALRDMNEKAYISWFSDFAPLTLITRSIREIRDFMKKHSKIVVKPLDGMGGKSIFVVDKSDNNANVIFETLTQDGTRFTMAQVYIPEIKAGDKRILLVDGIPVPYALARIPAADDNRGNLVMGATGKTIELSTRDRQIAESVGKALSAQGVMFAGIDVIGDYLTEVNVTSPTGIRELDRAFGLNIAGDLLDAIERRLA